MCSTLCPCNSTAAFAWTSLGETQLNAWNRTLVNGTTL